MSVVPRPTRSALLRRARLVAFNAELAPLIASWVRDAEEAYWVAPHSVPPITAHIVRDWSAAADRWAFTLLDEFHTPAGYGELNLLSGERREYWLGHLLIDPTRRGQGLGHELTSRLLERAFMQLHASRVALVVFQNNAAAIQCYRSCGLEAEGYEQHAFAVLGRSDSLLRMAIRRDAYATRRRGSAPPARRPGNASPHES